MPVSEKPNFWQKIGLQARKSQQHTITIYVCCPDCAAKAESDPYSSLAKVVIERGGGF